MSALFIILCGLALLHFVYEGILAPSIRFRIRLKLFVLRDAIREIEFAEGDAIDREVLADVHDSINTSVYLCSRISLSRLIEIKRFIDDHPKLGDEIDERMAKIDRCSHSGTRKIWENSAVGVLEALFVNSGGWMFLLVPVLLSVATLRWLLEKMYKCVAIPFAEIEKLTPDTPPAVA